MIKNIMSKKHRKSLQPYWNSLKGKSMSPNVYTKKAIKKRTKTRKEKNNYKHTKITKNKISERLIGNINKKGYRCTTKQKKKMSNSAIGNRSALGHRCNKQQRKNISNGHKGIEAWNKGTKGFCKPNSGSFQKGKKITDNEREKLRFGAIKRVERQNFNGQPLRPSIGKDETEILDALEIEYNIKIIRQYSIIGYFLDGYNEKLNIAFEIDEYHHQNQKEKDKQRENDIRQSLNCKFIRIEA